jgi:hypothetical protein
MYNPGGTMTLSEFFTAVQAALPARRGNLYEQYLQREGADGQMRRNGPYYVWTRCEGGKMVSDRVARDDVPRVREEIARGKLLDGLIDRLWELAEDLARNAGDAKKKSSKCSTERRPR